MGMIYVPSGLYQACYSYLEYTSKTAFELIFMIDQDQARRKIKKNKHMTSRIVRYIRERSCYKVKLLDKTYFSIMTPF